MPYSTITMASSSNQAQDPSAAVSSASNSSGGANGNKMNSNTITSPKYHALIIDSGAIIKQTSLSSFSSSSSILNSATHYYTVPAVLSEIRDAKSRQHLENFQLRLQSLCNTTLETRTPTQEGILAISNFAKKTGDYNQLSNVDLQILALLYDVEVECSKLYNDGNISHVRTEPKRVLGVNVQALSGDGKREVKKKGGSVATGGGGSVGTSCDDSIASSSIAANSIMSNTAFFRGNAHGIIDASNVDLDYGDDEDEGDIVIKDDCGAYTEEERQDSVVTGTTSSEQSEALKVKTWAKLVNPQKASNAPLVNYSLAASASNKAEETKEPEAATLDLNEITASPELETTVDGQFDDASSSEEEDDAFSQASDSDGELDAINIANTHSDDEMSDEECDVFILEPHEAAYFKKLKEQKSATEEKQEDDELVQKMEQQAMPSQENTNDEGLDSDFPSLSAAAEVPYEGSDDEEPEEFDPPTTDDAAWKAEEEERKKKSLQPMINGRVVSSNKKESKYNNPFRKYGNVVSASGSAVAMKKQKEIVKNESKTEEKVETADESMGTANDEASALAPDNQEYKSRILGAAATSATGGGDFPSEMTAEDDDGEGWVTCTRDIQTMKATGSLHLNNHSRNKNRKASQKKDAGPPISHRAACATTDFAMQNVILQMNLELLSVDGVRVRRLKTWVTRCGACFTIYGNEHGNKSAGGGRLFCDKCGSNTLQRIAASVDRNSGRLKLHMKKNYQYNTRGTKFSLPKAGKGNKYEGDLLLAEDQLLYGAWNQKVRKGKSKTSGQSIFGSDLASDLGCITDLTKRDDIKVGFGRRNPNSSKFGRERRGKKKKGTKDKACGLRRY